MVAKANTAVESPACFASSATTFGGLMVVMMAPMDKIAMHIMGKWIQFSERRIFKPAESDFTLP